MKLSMGAEVDRNGHVTAMTAPVKPMATAATRRRVSGSRKTTVARRRRKIGLSWLRTLAVVV
jgi:hypothetical protein